jgi:hypothetical protein
VLPILFPRRSPSGSTSAPAWPGLCSAGWRGGARDRWLHVDGNKRRSHSVIVDGPWADGPWSMTDGVLWSLVPESGRPCLFCGCWAKLVVPPRRRPRKGDRQTVAREVTYSTCPPCHVSSRSTQASISSQPFLPYRTALFVQAAVHAKNLPSGLRKENETTLVLTSDFDPQLPRGRSCIS